MRRDQRGGRQDGGGQPEEAGSAEREIAKQLRKIEDITDLDEDFVERQNPRWQQDLQRIEQRRNDLLSEHEQMQKMSLMLQSLQGKKLQSQKIGLMWKGCKQKWKTMETRFKHKRSMRRSWIGKSKHCKQKKADVAVA